MKDSVRFKRNLGQFGRALSLLLNRATMYQANHPYFKESLDSFYSVAEELLSSVSPLAFILTQERFFIDEEPLDPRINVGRMITHFKKAEIESVSFYQGVTKNELRSFVEIFTALHNYPNADAMTAALNRKNIQSIKINHIYYRKVSSEDEIVSRDALKQMSPEISAEAERRTKKLFLDSLMENVLSEELTKTLTVKNLIQDPPEFSRTIIANDLAAAARASSGEGIGGSAGGGPGGGGASPAGGPAAPGGDTGDAPGEGTGYGPVQGAVGGKGTPGGEPGHGPGTGQGAGRGEADAGGGTDQSPTAAKGGSTGGPGPVLAQQLQLLDDEIEKSLKGESDVDLESLAEAVFQMKAELMGGIEAQKALGTAYENELAILEKANDLTDKVFIQLVKDEYKTGKITPARMAQILRRLIPDPDELSRLLPKIKVALLEEGMPLSDYLKLVKELRREIEDEGLARLLFESSEQVGVDGDELIQEIKKDPRHAAELISLAAEIRKGTGDEQALTDILVEYVESLGTSITQDMAGKDGMENEDHLRQVMSGVESKLVKQLRGMDLQEEILTRIESKLNQRLDTIVDDLKVQWLKASPLASGSSPKSLTVLQTLERSISEEGELATIIKAVREKVDREDLEEDDFTLIYEEIESVKRELMEEESKKVMPEGVLSLENMTLFVKKEIAKAARYDLPFSALAFSVVTAKYKEAHRDKKIPAQHLLDYVLVRLARVVRDTDIVGKFKKNQMIVLLPMTPTRDAKLALKRTMKLLHSDPFEIQGVPLDVKIAGTAITFVPGQMPDAKAFMDTVSTEIVEMATRVKNIHSLY